MGWNGGQVFVSAPAGDNLGASNEKPTNRVDRGTWPVIQDTGAVVPVTRERTVDRQTAAGEVRPGLGGVIVRAGSDVSLVGRHPHPSCSAEGKDRVVLHKHEACGKGQQQALVVNL
ncbi:hypothetical protein BaRGS_00036985 [Batillaria attramentaria]|uniref:Uncharacterized protein n=1 Tax=Batillaria attramentaria TaxID=370345 RepID=A0ABD0JAE7_9CAEN